MNVLRKFILGLTLMTALLSGVGAFSQDGVVELSESDVKDVVELLKFVKSARPELFNKFAGSFEEVGASCSQNVYKEEYAREVTEMIAQIERELPETNKTLMTNIKLALFFGGRAVYRPEFNNSEHVRANISKFMAAVREAYLGKDFDKCARLVAIGLDTYSTSVVAQQ
jgi:hypothetical protein